MRLGQFVDRRGGISRWRRNLSTFAAAPSKSRISALRARQSVIWGHEHIARASPASRFFPEKAALEQIIDIAQCGVLRAFRDLRPFGGR